MLNRVRTKRGIVVRGGFRRCSQSGPDRGKAGPLSIKASRRDAVQTGMRHSSISLYARIEQAFEAGFVAAELGSLRACWNITEAEARDVFSAFVHATWGDHLCDGVLTHGERLRLKTIARALHLRVTELPYDIVRSLTGEAA